MPSPKSLAVWVALTVVAPSCVHAQTAHVQHIPGSTHAAMPGRGAAAGDAPGEPSEPGHATFAAIAEIVEILRADPGTEWSKVDIEGLRRHLIDMDNVTMGAQVAVQAADGGARFVVTSDDPGVTASIRRMVLAHAAVMAGVDGLRMQAEQVDRGAGLLVAGWNPEMIRGLGFIGLMTIGMHHQAHHLALARGGSPHAR